MDQNWGCYNVSFILSYFGLKPFPRGMHLFHVRWYKTSSSMPLWKLTTLRVMALSRRLTASSLLPLACGCTCFVESRAKRRGMKGNVWEPTMLLRCWLGRVDVQFFFFNSLVGFKSWCEPLLRPRGGHQCSYTKNELYLLRKRCSSFTCELNYDN